MKVYKIVQVIDGVLWSWMAAPSAFNRQVEIQAGTTLRYIPGQPTIPEPGMPPLYATVSFDEACEMSRFPYSQLWIAEAGDILDVDNTTIRTNSLTLIKKWEEGDTLNDESL